MIQPWSKSGSNITAITRPWTGIVLRPDGVCILVFCEASVRTEANELLQRQAAVFRGTLIATMFGHQDSAILKVAC